MPGLRHPHKRQQRQAKACEPCRAQKVRCSADQLPCTRCRQKGKAEQCIVREKARPKRARRNARDSTAIRQKVVVSMNHTLPSSPSSTALSDPVAILRTFLADEVATEESDRLEVKHPRRIGTAVDQEHVKKMGSDVSLDPPLSFDDQQSLLRQAAESVNSVDRFLFAECQVFELHKTYVSQRATEVVCALMEAYMAFAMEVRNAKQDFDLLRSAQCLHANSFRTLYSALDGVQLQEAVYALLALWYLHRYSNLHGNVADSTQHVQNAIKLIRSVKLNESRTYLQLSPSLRSPLPVFQLYLAHLYVASVTGGTLSMHPSEFDVGLALRIRSVATKIPSGPELVEIVFLMADILYCANGQMRARESEVDITLLHESEDLLQQWLQSQSPRRQSQLKEQVIDDVKENVKESKSHLSALEFVCDTFVSSYYHWTRILVHLPVLVDARHGYHAKALSVCTQGALGIIDTYSLVLGMNVLPLSWTQHKRLLTCVFISLYAYHKATVSKRVAESYLQKALKLFQGAKDSIRRGEAVHVDHACSIACSLGLHMSPTLPLVDGDGLQYLHAAAPPVFDLQSFLEYELMPGGTHNGPDSG